MRRNCHQHIWLLSGTGEGPLIAKALISKGWKVSVSVVTVQASQSYAHLPLESLWIGALDGPDGIRLLLAKTKEKKQGFDVIIDATHPFAAVISSNLKTVCQELNQPLIRFERSCRTSSKAFLIKTYEELLNFDLSGKRILFAIGSRSLPEAINLASQGGATVFARVLPTVEGLTKALACELPESHIAVLKPLLGKTIGEFESGLCRNWEITGVVARQSEGQTQMVWQNIAKEQKLDLWLISRPRVSKEVSVFHTISEMFEYLR
ncbi:precorrin-6A reductase [Prochlorococcus marinus]|uniref:precorrin-6A reductase n=1 Tax=Prochlorococcus marinus TaxID=1219 RepID=UPI0022B53D00|nr:precorrin-6A reductase [Prochlorococcus marinus]